MFSGEDPEQFAQDPVSSKGTGGHLLSKRLKGQLFWEGHKNLAHLLLIIWLIWLSNLKKKMDRIFEAFSEYLNFNKKKGLELC